MAAAERLAGEVTLSTFPPAMIVFMRSRIDEGATNKEVAHEFGVSERTVTAVRRTTSFNQSHLRALKKGLPDAFTAIVSSSLSAISPDKLSACSAPQLAMVAGVAYDKLRLASGESTQNVSFRDAGSSAIDRADVVEGMLKSLIAGLDMPALPAPAQIES